MVVVHLMPSLRPMAGGASIVEVEAATVQQMFMALSHRFPELRPHLETGVAVAIDGAILQDQLFAELPDGAEVHIMPMIAGG